jgi:phage-related protein
MSFLSSLFDFFKDFFKSTFARLVKKFIFVLKKMIVATLDALKALIVDLGTFIVNAAKWIITATTDLIKSVWSSIVAFVNSAIEWLLQELTKIVKFVADSIATIASTVASSLGIGPLILGVAALYLFINRKKNEPEGAH